MDSHTFPVIEPFHLHLPTVSINYVTPVIISELFILRAKIATRLQLMQHRLF